jgi:hypothetical protein
VKVEGLMLKVSSGELDTEEGLTHGVLREERTMKNTLPAFGCPKVEGWLRRSISPTSVIHITEVGDSSLMLLHPKWATVACKKNVLRESHLARRFKVS